MRFIRHEVKMRNEETEKEKTITEKEKQQILDLFVPSSEMRYYLAGQSLSVRDHADIIAGSLVSLELKANYAWGFDKFETERALSELSLRPGEMFCMTMKWYDENYRDERMVEGSLYRSLEKVIYAIETDRETYELDDDELTTDWYTLEKWVSDGQDKMSGTYDYILIGNRKEVKA